MWLPKQTVLCLFFGSFALFACEPPEDNQKQCGDGLNEGEFCGFGDIQVLTTVDSPFDLTLGDLNNDDRIDFIVSNLSIIPGNDGGQVFLGTEDNTFSPAQRFLVEELSTTHPLLLSDIDGDQILDLITATPEKTVQLLLGNGDGTFQPFENFGNGGNSDLVVGDFDQDGVLDLAAESFFDGQNGLEVFAGDGTGGFKRGVFSQIDPTINLEDTEAGDINQDGILDLIAFSEDGRLLVLLGVGDGSFENLESIKTAHSAEAIRLEDVDLDTALDVVLLDRENGNIVLLFGANDGSFETIEVLSLTNPGFTDDFAIQDLNRDQIPDIIVSDASPRKAFDVFLGVGDGTFEAPQSVLLEHTPSNHFAIQDINKDGLFDIISPDITDGTVTILFGLPQ